MGYSTIQAWIAIARLKDRCVNCLRPWKPFKPNTYCSYCTAEYIYKVLPQSPQHPKETQTEDTYLVEKSQTELQQGKDLIDNQKRQIEEMNSKILSLESKLESSNATIDLGLEIEGHY